MNKSLPVFLWIFVALVFITSFYILFFRTSETDVESIAVASPDSTLLIREVVAEVGSHVLYASDLALIRADSNAVESWTYDQLLACAAEEAGFENISMSRFVQERARQIYLRDLMIQNIYETTPASTEEEIQIYMNANPELFLVEKHYFQIITADSLIADSIHTRLSWGQNFQVTAQNISLGQKAAIGGDLGFVTGGEMLAQGLPRAIAFLDGLSDVVPSSIGWHIFKVSESRAIIDTTRVERSVAEILYNEKIKVRIDSVLVLTQNRLNSRTANNLDARLATEETI